MIREVESHTAGHAYSTIWSLFVGHPGHGTWVPRGTEGSTDRVVRTGPPHRDGREGRKCGAPGKVNGVGEVQTP